MSGELVGAVSAKFQTGQRVYFGAVALRPVEACSKHMLQTLLTLVQELAS